jgi:hypothetical protein
MRELVIEKEWITKVGYKAVVLFVRNSHRCGYVGIPETHQFYFKKYSDKVLIKLPDDTLIGKRNPIDLLLMACEKEESTTRVGCLFDVHGGITYNGRCETYPTNHNRDNGVKGQLWWFGYDCAHLGDKTLYSFDGEERTLDYCFEECESLAEQLKKYESSL